MAISPGFEKDIFISYCHTDNESTLGEGWIEQFHKTLRERLKQILGAREPGEEPVIWRDEELQGNEEFAEVLAEQLKQAALVVSVLTPSYVRSDWCKREIEQFVAAAEERVGLTVDRKTRLIKVVKTPVKRDQHPAPLRKQLGYKFYVRNRDDGIPLEFTLQKGDTNTALALERFNHLAHDIVNTLTALKETLGDGEEKPGTAEGGADGVANTSTVEPRPPRVPIYLAETSFDIEEDQESIRRELEARGYEILPAGELPVRKPEAFEKAVTEALKRCKLSIHMIGSKHSPVVAGGTEDTVALQNRLAAKASADIGFQRLIWLPPGLKSEDATQQQFIEALQNDPALQSNADVLQTPAQGLIAAIHDALQEQEARERRRGPRDRTSVYAVYSSEDKEAVSTLTKHLFELKYDVLEPLLDPNASDEQIAEIHKLHLTDCDSAVLFIDNASEFWLTTQLSELKRASMWRGGKPMKAQAIFLGPNKISAKEGIKTHLTVLGGLEEFTPETLKPFLEALEAAGTAAGR